VWCCQHGAFDIGVSRIVRVQFGGHIADWMGLVFIIIIVIIIIIIIIITYLAQLSCHSMAAVLTLIQGGEESIRGFKFSAMPTSV
jgi:hypothetical protein